MKKFIIISILMALFASGNSLMAQDNQGESLGLPGDNLNLYAVMKLFQESKTLEDFERSLNDQNSTINNLDLNGDNLVDYIKVIDNVDGDVHNIVLQVAVSPKENQDVAVFTVQRFQNGQVQIQLTGDEALYGKDYIIEPIADNANQGAIPNPGYTGTYARTTPVQVAGWPLVRFIFLPSYTIWHSSWYWGYYPTYWHPWRPYSWNYYSGYQYNWNHDYFGYYHRSDIHRYSRWNDFYYSNRRSYSPDVRHQIQMGNYKTTYSHPEQRKDGEAMFAKMHPDKYRKSTAISSGNNASVNRRPTGTMTNTNHPVVNNTATTRRPTNSSMTNKPVTNPSGNNTITNRRTTTPVTNRSVTNPSMEKSTVTTRSSTTKMTDKSGKSPSSHQNTVTNQTNNQSKKNVVKSSSRRNVKKTETTPKKDDKIKESENKDPNH